MNENSIAVIGAGKWGQALHFALNQKQDAFITSRTPKVIKNFVAKGNLRSILKFSCKINKN